MDASPNSPERAGTESELLTAQADLRRRLVRVTRELDSLRFVYCVALFAMILVCVSVSLFMFRQTSVIRVELAGRTQQVEALKVEYLSKEPMLRDFVARLQGFGAN